MIGYLKGDILKTFEDHLIVNVHGLGYEVFCSEQTLRALHGEARAEFWIHTHVREDQFTLFGFISQNEKQLFLSFLKVNGIGPKVAMKILGAAPIDAIAQMIENSDVRGLSQLPKVGKKTAEQIILSLKGKLVVAEEENRKVAFGARADIVSALVNLGFKMNEVERVVNDMAVDTDLQTGVRTGLQHLTSL